MPEYVSRNEFTKYQKAYLKVKRALDIVLAALLLCPALAVMFLAALWIRLESKGSALYRQSRTGRHQKIFTIYKLRSMRMETVDKDGRALTDRERLTKSGAFIRKASIDELPQILNILKGEMSFIGPRPFLINDLGTYNEEQLIRFEVLPGMTSWTALFGRANQTVQEKYDHEIYYVRHIGLGIDFYIFWRTIALVFSRQNVEDTVNDGRIAAEIIDEWKR